MKIGFGKQVLTIPENANLGGYAKRVYPYTTVHDPLYARAIFFEDIEKFVLVCLDFLAIDTYYFNKIEKEVKKQIGPIELNISVTHSHSAPELYFLKKNSLNESICAQLISSIVKAIKKAQENLILDPEFFYSEKILEGVSDSRTSKDCHINVKLKTINITKNSKSFAMLVFFPVHPTVLSYENLQISRDLIGYMVDDVENNLDTNVIFFQGACGDLSTRFTRVDQSFKSANLLGKKLADAVTHMEKIQEKISADFISIKNISVFPKIKEIKSEKELDNIIKKAEDELLLIQKGNIDPALERIYITKIQGGEVQKYVAKNIEHFSKEICAKIIKLGDVTIVFANGEFFYSIGERICNGLGKNSIFAGYSGGLVGYIVDDQNYDAGGYEVLSSIFEKGCDKTIIDSIVSSAQI